MFELVMLTVMLGVALIEQWIKLINGTLVLIQTCRKR